MKKTHKKDDISFKGEMIENELYRSADDVLDCDSNGDHTDAMMGDLSAARSLRENQNKTKSGSRRIFVSV